GCRVTLAQPSIQLDRGQHSRVEEALSQVYLKAIAGMGVVNGFADSGQVSGPVKVAGQPGNTRDGPLRGEQRRRERWERRVVTFPGSAFSLLRQPGFDFLQPLGGPL